MNSLFHGGSSSVAALKPFNEKPNFPPKPSFKNPSFFFQRFSRKAHLCFSCTTATSVAVLKPFNEKPYFPPKPSFFKNPSFFFQHFSQKAHLSFSCTTANRRKPFRKTTTRCCNGGEEERTEEEEDYYYYGGEDTNIYAEDRRGNYEIASTDGMKTRFSKLEFAIQTGIQEAIGVDFGVDLILKGVDDGCKQSDCVFEGEVDLFNDYCDESYGLVGYAFGRVRKDSVINGENIVAGDVLIGLPSSGVHCSGFSLVLDIISKGGVKGVAHITDGGFMKSIPGVFHYCLGLGATIHKDAWEVPAVFKLIQEAGRIEDAETRRTFNMGIGMVLVVSPDAAARILGEKNGGYSAYRIGQVTSGEGVTYQ